MGRMQICPNVLSAGKKRHGRGFSLPELEKAGLTWHQAQLLQIPVDRRRESAHAENVKVLDYLKSEAKKAASIRK
jgi:large subunit ribosomal protein L13e